MADGTVTIDTNLDNNGLQKGVKNIESSFDKLKSTVAKVVGAMGLAKLAKDGITYNATIEQLATSFEVMTGSAEKARDVIEELKRFGAETPYELTGLANTTQLLMQYGFTADEAIETTKQLGDISQGSADKMTSIATGFAQMSSAGKVNLQDIKQMINAGFNPLQEISKSTGESMSSLYDRISKGTMSVDEIKASMERATSAGGQFYQSMEKQSQTLNGQLSTLQDNFMEFLGNAVQPLSDLLRDYIIPAINDILTGGENLKAFIEEHQNLIIAITGVIGTLTGAIIAYTIATNASAIALGIYTTATTIATTVSTAFGAVMAFITSPITLVVLAIGALITIIVLLVKNWDTVKAKVVEVWDKITDTVKNAVEKVKTKVTEMWNKIKEIFDKVIDFVKNNWQGLLLLLVNPFAGAFKLLYDNCEGFRNFINNILNNIKNIVSNVFNAIRNKVSEVISSIRNFVSGGVSGIVSNIVNGLSNAFNSVVNVGKNIVEGLWNGIKNAGTWIKDKVKNFAKGILDGMKSALGIHSPSKVFEDQVGKNIALGVGEGFTENIRNVYAKMQRTVDAETSKLSTGLTASNNINVMRNANITSTLDEINTDREITVNAITNLDGKVLTRTVNTVNARQRLAYGIGG